MFGSSTHKVLLRFLQFLFFCFPFFVLFCLIHPIAVVFEVISFCVLCFFSPHKVVDVVFPSFLWSSDWSSCSDFVVQTRMPIKDLTCPSFFREGCNPFCHSPLHPSVCLYPAKYLHFFMCSSASLVLLLMNSIHSSSFSLLSISSSLSSWKETSLS